MDTANGPITIEGEMPQKKFYRSRAHCNPLSHNDIFDYPNNPSLMDWQKDHYPNISLSGSLDKTTASRTPDVLDVGCGFGGLTIALSKQLPESLILGLEIRAKVTEYVRLRIAALRKESKKKSTNESITSSHYENCSVLRTNSMKFMPNIFPKHSISKMFFCFPDPHFKKKNHQRRIITERLLTEYAYFLKPGSGKLYCITDVEDLHNWQVEKCDAHPMFRKLGLDDIYKDPCVEIMQNETEEGKKVARAGTAKYYAVYERIQDPVPDEDPNLWKQENFFQSNGFGVMPAL